MRPETKVLYSENWPDISRMVIERANHICQVCRRSPETHGIVLTTHHIDYNPGNNGLNNLVCLCQGCHLRWHGKDLKQATKYNQVDKLIRMGQLVFSGMKPLRSKNLARVYAGLALNTRATGKRCARQGT